jgi:serine kinase of HPr protein (carbohydrate metabolism regulator)
MQTLNQESRLYHASCIAINNHAVLIRGDSGSGKSDLALRLIDQGAQLIADDQVIITRVASKLVLSCPSTIRGLLEVRGLGLEKFPTLETATLSLVCDLQKLSEIERMPEPQTVQILGLSIPQLSIYPWEISATIKVQLALKSISGIN